jgi:hypothetical protein
MEGTTTTITEPHIGQRPIFFWDRVNDYIDSIPVTGIQCSTNVIGSSLQRIHGGVVMRSAVKGD